jgi:hypothetical protein
MMWACMAAVSVHLAAGALLAGHLQSGAGSDVAPTLSVRYLRITEQPSSVAAEPVPANPVPPQQGNASEEQVASADAGNQPKGDPTSQAKPRRYFDVSEVDTPALPTPDWALDPALLTHNAVQSLKVEVLVSETGRAERCTVVSMQPARPALRPLIAKQLCETRLTPAMRSGVAVPSVRHVEILISDE